MQCKCGYNFAREELKAMRKKKRPPFRSYAVIDYKIYRKFMKAEIKVWQEDRKSKKRLAAIAEAAQFVGTMLECPKCARIVIIKPDADDAEYYKPYR